MAALIKNKTTVVVSAAYNNGEMLYEGHKAPAKAAVYEIPNFPGYREVALRLVIPASQAEELCEGLISGSVDLTIQGMKTKVERHK